MEKIMMTFFEKYNDSLNEYFSDVLVTLKKKDCEYKDLCKKEDMLLKQFPALQSVIEDQKNHILSKEEINALIQFLSIDFDKKIKEYKEIFFAGGREAYYYFYNMDIMQKEQH